MIPLSMLKEHDAIPVMQIYSLFFSRFFYIKKTRDEGGRNY